MLNIRGMTIFPSAVEEVVREFSELGDEFEIVPDNEGGLDEITIVAEPVPDVPESQHSDLTERLVEAFRANPELRRVKDLRD